MIATFKSALGHFLRDERAQDAFEYLLVIGGISVAIIFAMLTPVGETLIDAVVEGTCAAMGTVVDPLDCTGITA
jgi:Flp pilus assembly pilin Flp